MVFFACPPCLNAHQPAGRPSCGTLPKAEEHLSTTNITQNKKYLHSFFACLLKKTLFYLAALHIDHPAAPPAGDYQRQYMDSSKTPSCFGNSGTGPKTTRTQSPAECTMPVTWLKSRQVRMDKRGYGECSSNAYTGRIRFPEL